MRRQARQRLIFTDAIDWDTTMKQKQIFSVEMEKGEVNVNNK